MQIILLHPRMTQAKSLALRPRHVALFAMAFVFCVLAVAGMLYYLTVATGLVDRLPFARTVRARAQRRMRRRRTRR